MATNNNKGRWEQLTEGLTDEQKATLKQKITAPNYKFKDSEVPFSALLSVAVSIKQHLGGTLFLNQKPPHGFGSLVKNDVAKASFWKDLDSSAVRVWLHNHVTQNLRCWTLGETTKVAETPEKPSATGGESASSSSPTVEGCSGCRYWRGRYDTLKELLQENTSAAIPPLFVEAPKKRGKGANQDSDSDESDEESDEESDDGKSSSADCEAPAEASRGSARGRGRGGRGRGRGARSE